MELRIRWEFWVIGKPQRSKLKEPVPKPSRLAGSRQHIKGVQMFLCQSYEGLVDAVSGPRHCRPTGEVVLGLMTARVQHNY